MSRGRTYEPRGARDARLGTPDADPHAPYGLGGPARAVYAQSADAWHDDAAAAFSSHPVGDHRHRRRREQRPRGRGAKLAPAAGRPPDRGAGRAGTPRARRTAVQDPATEGPRRRPGVAPSTRRI